MPDALRLGLTGGIGSGKSTIAALLAGHGAAVIDADAISRSTTATGGAAIAGIEKEFGAGFVGADGAMDRDQMRNLVYADPAARKRLEAILHPLIGQEIARQTDAAKQGGTNCIVFDIPLLVESTRWRHTLDQVLVIDCTPQTQIQRVVARSGLTPDAVEKIIATQAPRALRLRAADMVISNDQLSLAQLEAQVAQLWRLIGLSSRARQASILPP